MVCSHSAPVKKVLRRLGRMFHQLKGLDGAARVDRNSPSSSLGSLTVHGIDSFVSQLAEQGPLISMLLGWRRGIRGADT